MREQRYLQSTLFKKLATVNRMDMKLLLVGKNRGVCVSIMEEKDSESESVQQSLF